MVIGVGLPCFQVLQNAQFLFFFGKEFEVQHGSGFFKNGFWHGDGSHVL